MIFRNIELLPRESLVQTSEVDHADWNYKPILGILQRARFRLVASLMNDMQVGSILEIGYGSGVFFPHLRKHGEDLYGIDIHAKENEVGSSLREYGLAASLVSGSVSDMPYDDNSFDCAVAVSSMEYVEEIDQACEELKRVLKPGAVFVLVTPGSSPILDAGLKILGGEDADSNYGDRREKLIEALDRYFDIQHVRQWPRITLPGLVVYRALRLTVKLP